MGFDTDHKKWSALEEKRSHRKSVPTKVIYTSTRPNRDTTAQMKPADVWYTKSREWEYEQEWRITRPLDRPDRYIGETEVCLYEFPKQSVVEVILGCRSTEGFYEQVTEVLKEEPYRNCRLLRAVKDNLEFKLNIIPM